MSKKLRPRAADGLFIVALVGVFAALVLYIGVAGYALYRGHWGVTVIMVIFLPVYFIAKDYLEHHHGKDHQ